MALKNNTVPTSEIRSDPAYARIQSFPRKLKSHVENMAATTIGKPDRINKSGGNLLQDVE